MLEEPLLSSKVSWSTDGQDTIYSCTPSHWLKLPLTRRNPEKQPHWKLPAVLTQTCSQGLLLLHSSMSREIERERVVKGCVIMHGCDSIVTSHYVVKHITSLTLLSMWHLPEHLTPSPVYPVGQGPHVAPVPGAGTSVHWTPSKQDTTEQPSTSSRQNCPVRAVWNNEMCVCVCVRACVRVCVCVCVCVCARV